MKPKFATTECVLSQIVVAGCNTGAYVDSFEVSACTASGEDSCRFIGMRGVTSRIIHAYEKGKSGVVKASAVEVSDPDYWRWVLRQSTKRRTFYGFSDRI